MKITICTTQVAKKSWEESKGDLTVTKTAMNHVNRNIQTVQRMYTHTYIQLC